MTRGSRMRGPTFHPEEGKESDWPGEAKIAGRAIPAGPVTTEDATDAPDGEMFVADITEVVITGLDAAATKLVVEWWTPESGLQRIDQTTDASPDATEPGSHDPGSVSSCSMFTCSGVDQLPASKSTPRALPMLPSSRRRS